MLLNYGIATTWTVATLVAVAGTRATRDNFFVSGTPFDVAAKCDPELVDVSSSIYCEEMLSTVCKSL
jgi:hypothetical protein